jgi:hypothetical protein
METFLVLSVPQRVEVYQFGFYFGWFIDQRVIEFTVIPNYVYASHTLPLL